MTYLEILTDICSQLGDPSLDTFKERAKDHLLRAVSKLIQTDEFVVNDIPGYVKIKHGIDFADGGPEHLADTGIEDSSKWTVDGMVGTVDTTNHYIKFLYNGGFDGKVSQSYSNRILAGKNSKYYLFTCTVAETLAPDGTLTLYIHSFSVVDTSFSYTTGDKSVIFKSAAGASTDDFTLQTVDGGGNTQGEIRITVPSLQLLREEHIYDLNVQKILNLFVDPLRETGNNANLTITLIDYAKLARMVASSELEPSDEEMFVIYDEGKLILYITDSCSFDPSVDSISMQYVEWVDDSSWSDSTELTGTSTVAPLFSIPFIEKASEMAVQTLKVEEGQE